MPSRPWATGPSRRPKRWSAPARFLAALETTGELSIAKLTLANSQIHKLADI